MKMTTYFPFMLVLSCFWPMKYPFTNAAVWYIENSNSDVSNDPSLPFVLPARVDSIQGAANQYGDVQDCFETVLLNETNFSIKLVVPGNWETCNALMFARNAWNTSCSTFRTSDSIILTANATANGAVSFCVASPYNGYLLYLSHPNQWDQKYWDESWRGDAYNLVDPMVANKGKVSYPTSFLPATTDVIKGSVGNGDVCDCYRFRVKQSRNVTVVYRNVNKKLLLWGFPRGNYSRPLAYQSGSCPVVGAINTHARLTATDDCYVYGFGTGDNYVCLYVNGTFGSEVVKYQLDFSTATL